MLLIQDIFHNFIEKILCDYLMFIYYFRDCDCLENIIYFYFFIFLFKFKTFFNKTFFNKGQKA